jgi:nitroreductase
MLDNPDAKTVPNVAATPDAGHALRDYFVGALEQRRSVTPLKLIEPGPNVDELQRLLTIATRVPDHGILQPWRLIVAEGTAREALSGKLAVAYLDANAQQETAAADLAVRKIKTVFAAPLVVIVVSRANPAARIPEWEQILSAGAVCMNLITAATALGYNSTWLTGWSAYNPAALPILGVQPDEKVAGIIPIGTAAERPQDRMRPTLNAAVTMWTGQ